MISIYLTAIIFTLLLANPCFAEGIKYSVGPSCKDKKVICPNQNETPVCIVLDPRVHVEQTVNSLNKVVNRFEPSCGEEVNNFKIGCIDILNNNEASNKFIDNVSIDCIELVKCEKDKENNKISVSCSSGKMAKCLGSDDIPNCENDSMCVSDSLPVCDYVWQANL
jgi:hypothetical protein